MRVWPGNPYPLGASWDGAGVNFAIFAENATKVELCLFDSPDATSESHRIIVKEYTDKVWHAYLPDVLPGQLYGYRIHGPYEPPKGHRFNPNKIVLDPYAKRIGRPLKWDDSLFGYKVGDPEADLSFDDRDSAAYAPLASVIDPAFTWETTALRTRPGTRRSSTNCTSRASPNSTRSSPRTSAAATPGWPRSRRSST